MVRAVFIFFLIVFLLILDFRVKIWANYDFETNIGHITVKVFGIKIFSGDFSLVGKYINFVRNNKKVIQINIIDIDKKALKIFEDISKSFLKRVNVLRVRLESDVAGDNPYIVSLINGATSDIFGVVLSFIATKYEHAQLSGRVKCGYLEEKLMFSFGSDVVINLYDLIWSIIRNLYIRSFELYGEKRFGK